MSLSSLFRRSTPGRGVQFPIAYKLALVISLLTIIVMSLLGMLIIKNQNRLLETEMVRFGNSMARQMAEATKEPILANDRMALDIIINNITSLDNIGGAAIFSEEKKAIAAKGVIPETISQQALVGREIIRTKGALISVAPVIFRNLTAGHVVLSIDRSTLDAAQAYTLKTILLFTSLLVIFGFGISVIAGKRLARPIDQLLDGSNTINNGDYNFRFAQQRNDEIGLLMNSFNGLSEGLLEKAMVEQVFSKYVSPEVATRVLNDLEQTQLGGMRVYASVMFADIVGFTKLSESMEPDEINKLLNEYFSLIDKLVQTCRGHVDKFMGDCAMVVFGTPETDEKHALHAVECASLIHQAVEKINAERTEKGLVTVMFSIGINSGHMLAGNTGSERRMDYTVVGDSVNLASRLSSIAGAGETLVSEALHKAADLKQFFHTVQSAPISIRGKKDKISIYKVINSQPSHNAVLEAQMRTARGDT